MAISDRLEELTDDYGKLADRAANAEADYRLRFASTLIRLKDGGSEGKRMTDKMAEAQASVRAAEELRAYKITAASLDASRQALTAHRARLDALRTLAASARSLTVAG